MFRASGPPGAPSRDGKTPGDHFRGTRGALHGGLGGQNSVPSRLQNLLRSKFHEKLLQSYFKVVFRGRRVGTSGYWERVSTLMRRCCSGPTGWLPTTFDPCPGPSRRTPAVYQKPPSRGRIHIITSALRPRAPWRSQPRPRRCIPAAAAGRAGAVRAPIVEEETRSVFAPC